MREACNWLPEFYSGAKWVLGLIELAALVYMAFRPAKMISTFVIWMHFPLAFFLMPLCVCGSLYLVQARGIGPFFAMGQAAWISAPLAYMGGYLGRRWMSWCSLAISLSWPVVMCYELMFWAEVQSPPD